MNPEPSEAMRASGAPGAPFSPRNSRNTSSRVRPGEFWGVSCVGGAVRAAVWVDTFTTLPTSRPVNCANRSTKGVSATRGGAGAAEASGSGAGRGAAAVPGSGGGGVPGAAGLSCDGAALGAVGTALDCANAGAAMMANSAHEAAIELPRRRKACKMFSYSLESLGFIRCGGRTSRSERGAPGRPLSSGDSPQWRAEGGGGGGLSFRAVLKEVVGGEKQN